MKSSWKALLFTLGMVLVSGVYADAVTTTTSVTTAPVTTVVPVPPSAPVIVVPRPPAQTTTISSTTTTTNGVSESDGRIISSIYGRYGQDAALIGTSITATSVNGIVTLSGSVTAQSQADEAVIAAKKVPGVKGVLSNISVMSNPSGSFQPTVRNY